MKVYTKQTKADGVSSYFGNFGEIPVGISVAHVDEVNQNFRDTKHIHHTATEYYIVTQGKLLLEVNGSDIEADADSVVMVEPQEPHFVKSILSFPCAWISIASPKGDASDKVIIE